MALTPKATKQWSLTKHETITSVTNWRQKLEYTLATDPRFDLFLEPNATWLKTSPADANRGFTDTAGGLTAIQKVKNLELCLGQIANYCPVISRGTIINKSTSLSFVWEAIRLHFGF